MPRKPLAHAAAGARFTTKRRAYGGGLEGSRAKAADGRNPISKAGSRSPAPAWMPGENATGRRSSTPYITTENYY